MSLLHVTSKSASFAEFVQSTVMPVYQSYQQGDVKSAANNTLHKQNGFSCTVADGDWADLAGQIADSTRFIQEYQDELLRLHDECQVDQIYLEIALSAQSNDSESQTDYFPPDFLKLLGRLKIGMKLSQTQGK